MKKGTAILVISSSLSLLFGCSTSQNEPSINNDSSSESVTPSSPSPSSNNTKRKSLVVYFSATSHTKAVAETIAHYIDSPLYELEPVNPYTSADLNYGNPDSRVVEEHLITQSGERVNVELKNTKFDEFADADYVFLGAPVWWQQLSWVIENFVSDNDFSNKTIIPFGTSASSGFNLNNLTPLTEDDSNVKWLSPQRFSSSVSSNTVTSWIDSLNLE